MVNKIPWLANFQSESEHSSIPTPELDGVAAGCHSSLQRFAGLFKTTAGLHTNSQASGDSLVKVTTSSVLCGLWRSQNPLGSQILRSGVREYHQIITVSTRGYLWADNRRGSWRKGQFWETERYEIRSGYVIWPSKLRKPWKLLGKAGKGGLEIKGGHI